jgi:hypothetical protein
LRLVAWNCRQAFASKRRLVDALDADLVVVPECGKADVPAECSLWVGLNQRKGLGLYTTIGTPRLLDIYDERLRWFLPVQIDGARSLTVLAVWAFNHRDRLDRCSDLATAVTRYRDLLVREQVVIIGDINDNATWDGPRRAHFRDAVAALAEIGYVSAYHSFFGEVFGEESRPTHRHSRGGTYHVDFCFLPREWMPRVSVDVPPLGEWAMSDHAPLIVDLGISRPRTVPAMRRRSAESAAVSGWPSVRSKTTT